MSRKPWEIPIEYNDDRWVDPQQPNPARVIDESADVSEHDVRDIEELLRRPDRREGRTYECTDTTPVDYTRGPHSRELDVDDRDIPDPDPVPSDDDDPDLEGANDEDWDDGFGQDT